MHLILSETLTQDNGDSNMVVSGHVESTQSQPNRQLGGSEFRQEAWGVALRYLAMRKLTLMGQTIQEAS
jgi:hypothetical protein